MLRALGSAFVKYHRGLGLMPRCWKPWLLSLLTLNMIAPLCFVDRWEARWVFGVALLNGALFVVLTAISGFSRLLGLGHIFWFPLIFFLWTRVDAYPAATAYGLWMRATILFNAISLVLDMANVMRYLAGDRREMVAFAADPDDRGS